MQPMLPEKQRLMFRALSRRARRRQPESPKRCRDSSVPQRQWRCGMFLACQALICFDAGPRPGCGLVRLSPTCWSLLRWLALHACLDRHWGHCSRRPDQHEAPATLVVLCFRQVLALRMPHGRVWGPHRATMAVRWHGATPPVTQPGPMQAATPQSPRMPRMRIQARTAAVSAPPPHPGGPLRPP